MVAEVAPLPLFGAGAEALGALATFLTFVVCFGLALAWNHTVGAGLIWLANILDKASVKIPVVGRVHLFGVVSAGMRGLSKNVSHLLGAAALASQHASIFLWNQAAATWRFTSQEIEALAKTLYRVAHFAKYALPGYSIAKVIRLLEAYALRELRHLIHALGHRVTIVTKTVHVVTHQVTYAAHSAAHAADVALSWRGISLKQWKRALRRVGRLEHRLTGAAAAALVAAALARLGLKWLRCSKNKDVAKAVCGMDANLLNSLLLDATAIIGTISIIEFARELQAVEGEAVGLIHGFIREA